MYAVIRAGGKQHKVQAGDVIQVELGEGSPGDKVTFEPVLVVEDDGSTHFGKDVAKAVVSATLVGAKKGEKVRVFKYRQKTGYSRRQGYRASLTSVEINDVKLGARKPAAKTAEPAASGESE